LDERFAWIDLIDINSVLTSRTLPSYYPRHHMVLYTVLPQPTFTFFLNLATLSLMVPTL
jgi:hypothetical protein